MSPKSRWGVTKVLCIVRSADPGIRHWSLRIRPMVLFIIVNTSASCSSNDKRLSSIITRCLCDAPWWTILLLKVKGEWESLLNFLPETNSWACLLESGLKLIFHWCNQWLILAKPLSSSAAELSILCTTENIEVSSANNLALDNKV